MVLTTQGHTKKKRHKEKHVYRILFDVASSYLFGLFNHSLCMNASRSRFKQTLMSCEIDYSTHPYKKKHKHSFLFQLFTIMKMEGRNKYAENKIGTGQIGRRLPSKHKELKDKYEKRNTSDDKKVLLKVLHTKGCILKYIWDIFSGR